MILVALAVVERPPLPPNLSKAALSNATYPLATSVVLTSDFLLIFRKPDVFTS